MKRNAPYDNEPQYYICARRDNGFIAAYRAYFYIRGNKVKKIGGFRYERTVIFRKSADAYEYFSPKYCVFNIKAKSNDPTDWKIFRDGNPVPIGGRINFGSVRDFHRL